MARNEYHYANSKKVVVELFGEVQGLYDCISDVGRRLGHSVTTITNRIKSGRIVDGWLVRWPKEDEDLSTMPHLSPPKKRGKIPKAEKGVYVDENGNLIAPEIAEKRERKKRQEQKAKEKPRYKEVELDRERYLILKYEVRNIVQCITPCPFMLAPKAMVGSPRCQQCSSFRGRNKETHEVACKRKLYQ